MCEYTGVPWCYAPLVRVCVCMWLRLRQGAGCVGWTGQRETGRRCSHETALDGDGCCAVFVVAQLIGSTCVFVYVSAGCTGVNVIEQTFIQLWQLLEFFIIH